MINRLFTRLATGLTLVAGLATSSRATAADWPQWRGPNQDDHSPDTGLLKSWPSGGPKRLWLNENAGLGYAGNSVVGGKLYTMGSRDGEDFVIALDAATGKELWATSAGGSFQEQRGDGPRMTPSVDGNRVFALSANGRLFCVDAATGKPVWQKSLTDDLGGGLPHWAYSESVLVEGDFVYCTPGGEKGTMAALRKETGEVAWRTKEVTDAAHYSTPIVINPSSGPQIVQLVEKKVFGVSPTDGKLLWSQEWKPGKVAVIPTPIYHDGQIFISSGYGAGCMLVKLGAGNTPSVVYENKVMQNHHGGVVLVGEHLYGFSREGGEGRWICQSFKTGEEVWSSKALGKGAVTYADGMLYCISEESGDVALVQASPKGWAEYGRFKLEPQSKQRKSAGRIWVHPVVIDGRLYLRDQEFLSCYDVKG